jgi:hypothetical protein
MPQGICRIFVLPIEMSKFSTSPKHLTRVAAESEKHGNIQEAITLATPLVMSWIQG